VRKTPEPSVTLVALSGGGDPRTLFEVVRVLNAAGAPMIGNPIDVVGEAGQLAGAAMAPFPKASLLLLSGNPSSGSRMYPWSKTRGRGDDPTGKPDQAWSARASIALSPLSGAALTVCEVKMAGKRSDVNPRSATDRRPNFTM
jgi:hypothetical protein